MNAIQLVYELIALDHSQNSTPHFVPAIKYDEEGPPHARSFRAHITLKYDVEGLREHANGQYRSRKKAALHSAAEALLK